MSYTQLVVHYFQHKYPHTSFWLSGHSLGGSVASLVGIRRGIPTVTFEAPGERLAALRMGLVPSIPEALDLSHITHVYNDVDPLAQGLCTGSLSLCAQAGYAIEAKCHTSRVIVYQDKKPGWSLALQAHRMDHVISILENEEIPVPEAVPQTDCEVCNLLHEYRSCLDTDNDYIFVHRTARPGISASSRIYRNHGGADCWDGNP